MQEKWTQMQHYPHQYKTSLTQSAPHFFAYIGATASQHGSPLSENYTQTRQLVTERISVLHRSCMSIYM